MKENFSHVNRIAKKSSITGSIVSLLVVTMILTLGALPVFASGPDGFFNNIFADGNIQGNQVVMGLKGVLGESNQQNAWGVMGNALATGSTGGVFMLELKQVVEIRGDTLMGKMVEFMRLRQMVMRW